MTELWFQRHVAVWQWELKVLEKIAAAGKFNIVLGEKGLADKVVNLL